MAYTVVVCRGQHYSATNTLLYSPVNCTLADSHKSFFWIPTLPLHVSRHRRDFRKEPIFCGPLGFHWPKKSFLELDSPFSER